MAVNQEMKVEHEAPKKSISALTDCCKLLREENQKLKNRVRQLETPLRSTIKTIDIDINTKWIQNGVTVAGGHGFGNGLNQLWAPHSLYVDDNHHTIYFADDKDNHRVMMWTEDADEGIIVAGGRGKGNDLTQLKYPYGMAVDQSGTVYVADSWNNRIMRWIKGATQGSLVVGGNGEGEQPNQLNYPFSISFDRHVHLYIADYSNHRILKFQMDSSNSSS